MIKNVQLVWISALLFILTSCGVPKAFRNIQYFRDTVTEAEKITRENLVTIKPGDRLGIDITAINKEAAGAFAVSAAGTGSGYLVDSAGYIELLQLEKIHAGGLTPAQVKAVIEEKLENYLKGAIVTVSIVNFKVNMMGEVGTPGVLTVPDGKITILQALTQAGDVGIFGKRTNILVIREVNGKREFGRIDITSNHVFESPYYYLEQNDIVYVEADETKYISNNPRLERDLRNLGIATTLLTTVILVINLFK